MKHETWHLIMILHVLSDYWFIMRGNVGENQGGAPTCRLKLCSYSAYQKYSWTYISPACTKMYLEALESCPYKEALLENTGNNWTDSCSESRTSSNVTIIRHITGISCLSWPGAISVMWPGLVSWRVSYQSDTIYIDLQCNVQTNFFVSFKGKNK